MVFAALLGGMAGIAMDPRVVHIARLPSDRVGGCFLAQPLATNAAMGFSYCIVLLHIDALCSLPRRWIRSQF